MPRNRNLFIHAKTLYLKNDEERNSAQAPTRAQAILTPQKLEVFPASSTDVELEVSSLARMSFVSCALIRSHHSMLFDVLWR
jgi:hypothetical protein